MIKEISILGLGLIGGSVAKAIRKNKPEIRIKAFDKPEVLNAASDSGLYDTRLSSIEEAADSDIIFLCMPALYSVGALEKLAPLVKADCIITDVCGVKGLFEDKWKSVQSRGTYAGGHPMAGKEKSGFENSDEQLFENCIYVISTSVKDSEKVIPLIDIIESFGARIRLLNPYLHDKIVSDVSHVPQLLAVALVNTAANEINGINYLDFAAGGFRDMTRIASADYSKQWEHVIKANKKEILPALDRIQKTINLIKHSIHNKRYDELGEYFEIARKKRDEIPRNVKGLINPLFDVYVGARDEPGILHKITDVIQKAKLNIRDIELLKVREGTGGTFRISFASETEAETAKAALMKKKFEVN
jgi:prephenate dehydrogenase